MKRLYLSALGVIIVTGTAIALKAKEFGTVYCSPAQSGSCPYPMQYQCITASVTHQQLYCSNYPEGSCYDLVYLRGCFQ